MAKVSYDIGKDFGSTVRTSNYTFAKTFEEKILRKRVEEILDCSIKGMGRILQDKLRESHPTDYCELKSSMVEKIRWDGDTGCPSDILFSGTIPIKDLIMRIHSKDGLFDCRAVVVENFLSEEKDSSQLNEAFKNGRGLISLILVIGQDLLSDLDNYIVGMPVVVSMTSNSVGFGKNIFTYVDEHMGYDQVKEVVKRLETITNFTYKELKKCFAEIYTVWYGLQVQLLHPEIKEVYKRRGTVSVNTHPKQEKRGTTKRKVEYVKRLCIDRGEYAKLEGRTYNRKMAAWYVTGHWRNYKDGKKVFINGYWKGALRDTKKKEAEIRERVAHTSK